MKDQECYWNDYDLEILIAILTMGPVIIWSPCLIEVNGGFQSIVNKSKMLKINIMSKIGFFFIRRQQALLMSPIVITHSIMSSPASSAPSSSCQNSSWHDCESMIFPWRWKPWNCTVFTHQTENNFYRNGFLFTEGFDITWLKFPSDVWI